MKQIRLLTLTIFFLFNLGFVNGQISDSVTKPLTRNYFPIWTYHQKNKNIHGISVGLWSIFNEPRHTNTNGIKIELIGFGIFMPLIPESPVAQDEAAFLLKQKIEISERINGISLSTTGTVCNCDVNGISAGVIAQINYKINGISISGLGNFTQIHNGIQIGGLNQTYKLGGIQIGLYNQSHRTKGIQIGLWNVNERRSLPLINWNFKTLK